MATGKSGFCSAISRDDEQSALSLSEAASQVDAVACRRPARGIHENRAQEPVLPTPGLCRIFPKKQLSLLLATHIHLLQEFELINAAKFLGISYLGIVRSWDNVYKGLQSRTDHVAVWNDINRNEVIEFDRYRPRDVTTIGVPQFDPYFASDVLWPRQKLAAQFNLDPARHPSFCLLRWETLSPVLMRRAGMDVLLGLSIRV